MSRYTRNRDPYWLTAKFDGQCSQCKTQIKRGARAFYYPASRTLLCDSKCGQDGSNALQAEKSMEQFGTDCAFDS